MVVLGGCSDSKELDFERNESAFYAKAQPAACFPVVHIEELVRLVTFVQRERILSFVCDRLHFGIEFLGIRIEVQVVLGIDHLENGLGNVEGRTHENESRRFLNVVSEL